MIKWFNVTSDGQPKSSSGIYSIAFENNEASKCGSNIIGYNGIVIGDSVLFNDKVYEVQSLSMLGIMRIAKKDAPSNNFIAVYPSEVIKYEE